MFWTRSISSWNAPDEDDRPLYPHPPRCRALELTKVRRQQHCRSQASAQRVYGCSVHKAEVGRAAPPVVVVVGYAGSAA